MTSYIPSHFLMRGDRTVPKEAVFTMKLEPELRVEFMAEAARQPASQVVRELMCEFVQRQREAREYDQFLRHKVEIARSSMHAGLGRSNEEVEADLAYRKDSRVNE
jgi:predicted transcriptional regulator